MLTEDQVGKIEVYWRTRKGPAANTIRKLLAEIEALNACVSREAICAGCGKGFVDRDLDADKTAELMVAHIEECQAHPMHECILEQKRVRSEAHKHAGTHELVRRWRVAFKAQKWDTQAEIEGILADRWMCSEADAARRAKCQQQDEKGSEK